MMTFEHIAQAWQKLRGRRSGEERYELLCKLFAPDGSIQCEHPGYFPECDHQGWFKACRAWVHSESPIDAPRELTEVFSALPTFMRLVAEAYLACADTARQAQVLALPEDGQKPVHQRTAPPAAAQALVEASCKAIIKLERAWSGKKEIEPFVARPHVSTLAWTVLDSIHWPGRSVSAADLVVQTFRQLRPFLETPAPSAWSTASHLTLTFLEPPRQEKGTETPDGIRLFKEKGERESRGEVVNILLDLIPDGVGCFYITPAWAFVERDNCFRAAEASVRTCIQEHYELWQPTWDVRWSVRRQNNRPFPFPLEIEGPSLGGAWGLGIAKLMVGRNVH